MNLKDLIRQLQGIQDEVAGGTRHAAISGEVVLMCHENDVLDEYHSIEVAPIRASGCGCWVGAYLVIGQKAPTPQITGPPSGDSAAPRQGSPSPPSPGGGMEAAAPEA